MLYYSSRLIKIMPPKFIVMYNGADEYPDESELRLSNAFTDESASLELKETLQCKRGTQS